MYNVIMYDSSKSERKCKVFCCSLNQLMASYFCVQGLTSPTVRALHFAYQGLYSFGFNEYLTSLHHFMSPPKYSKYKTFTPLIKSSSHLPGLNLATLGSRGKYGSHYTTDGTKFMSSICNIFKIDKMKVKIKK